MTKTELKELSIDCLQRGKYQPRRMFTETALQELADSLKSQGIIQPIVVRPLSTQRYEIIAGERRWRAAQLAGFRTVPCLIRNFTDEQALAVTIVENVQRQDVNPIEEAQSYQRLIDDFNYFHEEVAAVVGVSRAKITNALRLLKLEPTVQTLLIDGNISAGHGKILASLSNQQQISLAQKIIKHNWSVRRLERETQCLASRTSISLNTHDANIVHLERIISEQVGAEVTIQQEAHEGGWLQIRYFNQDTLMGLLDKMGIKPDFG